MKFTQAEAKMAKPAFPILFYKPVTSLIGPLATVVIPRVAQPPKEYLPDYEVELVIVIGKAAKDVSEAKALDYVLGYTGANDVCCFDGRSKTAEPSLTKDDIGLVPQTSARRLPVGILQELRYAICCCSCSRANFVPQTTLTLSDRAWSRTTSSRTRSKYCSKPC